MRLQLSDIVIKSPGVQLREQIMKKYGSIKAFAEVVDLYESSIIQYLSSKKLGSSTFKIRTMQAFEMDFNELFQSDEAQIDYLVAQLSLHIDRYIYKEDIQVLEKLKMLCLEYRLFEDYAVVCRSYAHFYLNSGKCSRAKAYIDVATNTMRTREYIDRFGLYLSDQIVFEAVDMTKTAFKKAIEEFKQTIKKMNGPLTKGHMYFNLGQAYFDLKIYQTSKSMYKKVFEYHKDSKGKSLIYIKLGDVEKALNNYEAAFAYYSKAESLLEDEEGLYYIYDEYASYYLKKDMLKEAEKYIDRVFNDEKWVISSSKNWKMKTFINVKLACNKEGAVVNLFERLMHEINDNYIYTMHHLTLMDDVIMKTEISKSCLGKINQKIMLYYRKHSIDVEDDKMLRQLLGSIALKLSDL